MCACFTATAERFRKWGGGGGGPSRQGAPKYRGEGHLNIERGGAPPGQGAPKYRGEGHWRG